MSEVRKALHEMTEDELYRELHNRCAAFLRALSELQRRNPVQAAFMMASLEADLDVIQQSAS